MALDIVVGLQWGDEGKGKIVDLLSDKYQYTARFQGGPNAGRPLGILRDFIYPNPALRTWRMAKCARRPRMPYTGNMPGA